MELYNGRVAELNSVTHERDDIRKQYDELRKRRWYSTLIIFSLFIFVLGLKKLTWITMNSFQVG